MNSKMRSIPVPVVLPAAMLLAAMLIAAMAGCAKEPQYGVENSLQLKTRARQVWAVAPAVNLSGQEDVDALLQADLLYQQLQQVQGLTVIPVNRVVEVYAGLGIRQVQSEEQAALVCEMLGCDGLLVPTVTAFDAYDPPVLGASLQLFGSARVQQANEVNPRVLSRRATPPPMQALPQSNGFIQVVGLYDASNGSVRQSLSAYAAGRNDPKGPMGERQYLVDMDRFCGFVYHQLITDLLSSPRLGGA